MSNMVALFKLGQKLYSAEQRAAHINMLVCNIGLELCPKVDHLACCLRWVLRYHEDGPGSAIIGEDVYAHERSAVRAIWRLYREQTGE